MRLLFRSGQIYKLNIFPVGRWLDRQKEGYMSKFNVAMPTDWKKIFTIAQVESIKEIRKDPEFMDTVETMITTFVGNRELLKVDMFFQSVYNRGFYDNHIDILCVIWTYDSTCNEVRKTECYFEDINEITGFSSRQSCGWFEKYNRV